MQMNQKMQSQGQWLFRWRSYLPLLFLVLLIPIFANYRYLFENYTVNLIWEISCLCVGLLGLTIRCLVTGYAAKNTSGRNTKNQVADTLNTTGMYSLIRNPLYIGNFFMYAAPILLVHTWWLFIIYVLVFTLYYERIVMTEEAFLTQKFGDEYLRWTSQTPAFFPRRLSWVKTELPFSWKYVLHREYHGLFNLIAAFTVLKLIGNFCVYSRLAACSDEYIAFIDRIRIDPVWMAIFIVGIVFYITVRILSKCTRILHVEGR